MRILAFQADRAITVFHFDTVGQGNFKADFAAMTAALMPSEFTLGHGLRKEYWRGFVKPGFCLFKLTGQTV